MDQKHRIYQLHAEICKALSHPKRLEILDILREDEHSVEEIGAIAGMQSSNLSQHLAVLRKANLVATRREGLYVYYTLANRRIVEVCDLLREVLAETLVENNDLASLLESQRKK